MADADCIPESGLQNAEATKKGDVPKILTFALLFSTLA
jgi:hypothetical protein